MLPATIRTAFKVFLRRKFFTAASLFGIAFALTVLLVLTALADHVFGPRAPEVFHARSLGVFSATMKGESRTMIAGPGFRLLHDTLPGLPGVERASIFTTPDKAVTYLGDRRIELWTKRTDGAFWDVMRFRFLEGGPYSESDDRDGRLVAVVNESTRRKLFGTGPALGKTFELEDRTFRVVGVVPDIPFLRFVPFSDVWVPTGTMKTDSYRRDLVGSFMGVIVAKDRAGLPAIQAEFRRRVKAETLPDPLQWSSLDVEAETIFHGMLAQILGGSGDTAKVAAILGLVVFLFVAIPVVNLVNLSVSRILERSPEIGVRKAFGATSRTLVVQFVTENVILTLAGGALALAASAGILALANHVGVVPHAQFGINLRVFLAGILLTLGFGVVSGAWPAWRMSRLHPVVALKGGL